MDVEKAIDWAVTFAPGFIAFFMFTQVIDSSEIKEFEFVFYLVLLSIVTWMIANPFIMYFNWQFTKSITIKDRSIGVITFNLIIGSLVGLSFAYISEKNLVYRTMSNIPIINDINVVSSENASAYILNLNTDRKLQEGADNRKVDKIDQGWVNVQIDNGPMYQGFPFRYSSGKKPIELYLSPACVLDATKNPSNMKKVKGPGVLLFQKFIKSIQIVNTKDADCAWLWSGKTKPN